MTCAWLIRSGTCSAFRDELFAAKELVVQHGALDRFPAFVRDSGSMERRRQHLPGIRRASASVERNRNGGVQIAVVGAHASALLRLGMTVYFTSSIEPYPTSSCVAP